MTGVGELVKRECPSCGSEAHRRTYDVGSGPELCCANCGWCWGADGQMLKPVEWPKAVLGIMRREF